MRLHTICHISRETNHLCSMHYFHKIQNVVLILSQHSQEQIARELLLRQFFLFRFLFLSLSRSTLLVSCSLSALSLSRSICSSDGPSIPLSFSLSLYVCCLSPSLVFSLFLAQSLTHSIRLTSLSLFILPHPLTHSIRMTSFLVSEKLPSIICGVLST